MPRFPNVARYATAFESVTKEFRLIFRRVGKETDSRVTMIGK